MLDIILFLLVIPHNNSFIEYYAIYHFYTVNSIEYGYVIEDNITLFQNGTVHFNFYLINLNASKYLGPISLYNNISSPTSLYIFQGVGDSMVVRGNLSFILVGKTGSYYIYKNVQQVSSTITIDSYYYVNESGVPYKIMFLQYYLNQLVSNTTFILYSSNLLNPNAKLYFPQGLQKAMQSVSLTPSFEFDIQNVIFSTLLVLSALILSIKYYNREKRKKVR